MEKESDAFGNRVLQLVQQLTSNTEAAQKLVEASVDVIFISYHIIWI